MFLDWNGSWLPQRQEGLGRDTMFSEIGPCLVSQVVHGVGTIETEELLLEKDHRITKVVISLADGGEPPRIAFRRVSADQFKITAADFVRVLCHVPEGTTLAVDTIEPPTQAALAEFVSCGSYDRHLNRLRRALRLRRDAMLEALSQEMPAGTLWTRPEGGYQVWVELPFEVDTRDLLADAARAGVLFAPGSQFLPGQGPSRCLRLTLAQADEDGIRRGVAALGEVVRERIRAEPSASRVASVYL